MLDEEIMVAIQEQNLSYLLLAQKLLTDDREMAKFRLNFSDEMADLISALNTGQLLELSASSQLLCNLGINDAAKFKKIITNERAGGTIRLHMAMMLASSPTAGSAVGAIA